MTSSEVQAWDQKCSQMAEAAAYDKAVSDIVSERSEVDCGLVASALAEQIVDRDEFQHSRESAVMDGVQAAIDEVDGGTFEEALEAIQARVSSRIEEHAKQIALRMLRGLAAKAEGDSVPAA